MKRPNQIFTLSFTKCFPLGSLDEGELKKIHKCQTDVRKKPAPPLGPAN